MSCFFQVQALLDCGYLKLLMDFSKSTQYWTNILKDFPEHPVKQSPNSRNIPLTLYGGLPTSKTGHCFLCFLFFLRKERVFSWKFTASKVMKGNPSWSHGCRFTGNQIYQGFCQTREWTLFAKSIFWLCSKYVGGKNKPEPSSFLFGS